MCMEVSQGTVKTQIVTHPRVSDSTVGPGWGQRTCISNKFQMTPMVLGPPFGSHCSMWINSVNTHSNMLIRVVKVSKLRFCEIKSLAEIKRNIPLVFYLSFSCLSSAQNNCTSLSSKSHHRGLKPRAWLNKLRAVLESYLGWHTSRVYYVPRGTQMVELETSTHQLPCPPTYSTPSIY